MTTHPGLPPALDEALSAYAAHDRIVCGTDFDGVLAPLVDDPSRATPVPGSIDLLRRLATLPGVTVAVISGRDLETLHTLTGIGSDEPIVLVGSHGAQSSRPLPHTPEHGTEAQQRLEEATMALQSIALAHAGTRVEHKQAGVVLHTRGVKDEVARRAAEAARTVPHQVPGTHLMVGKDVIEIAVFDVSKGDALVSLRAMADAQAICYLGDDRTDELAFRILEPRKGDVSIKVGPGETVAAHRISDSTHVVEVLSEIAARRSAG